MSDSDISSDLTKKETEVSENGDADKTKMETDQDESRTEDNSKVEEEVKKGSPKKKEKKKKGKGEKEEKIEEKEEEDKAENEDEEEEDEEEPPLGLLERPIELTSGKREKKKVERLSMSVSLPSSEKKKIDIPEGSGKRLGDCPRIEFKLNQIKAVDLKPLHRLLYNRAGSNTEVKKNIKQFSGFNFGKSDKEFEKRTATLNKMTIPQLKHICEVLDIERSGTKPAIIERIMDFLLKPTSSGLKVPEKKKKKPKSGGDADKKKGTKRKRTSKKDKKAKKETVSDISDSDDDDDEEEEEEEEEKKEEKEEKKKEKKEEKVKPKAKAKKESDEEDEEEEEEEVEEEPPKKKTKTDKKPAKKEAPKTKKQNGKQEKAKPDKKKKKESKKKTSDSESDMDSDDEPLAAKKDEPPSNSELKELIKKLLDGANLEEVTMKTVVKQVYDKYPNFDLTDRKDFIKTTVREIIS